MPKDLQELHECIAMSLPRLQLAFIHLPENDSDRSKFMVGLECKMVWVDEPTSWCQGLKVIQNEIYVLYGATCQWDSPVAVHPGVLMCSRYINCFTLQTEILLLLLSSLRSSFQLIHHHLKSTTIGLKISGGQFWLERHFLLLQYACSNRKSMLTTQQ